jgi:hypothetical protein
MTSAATYLLVALGGLLAAAVTGYVAWKVAKRKNSGSVDTSEAASLWKEGASLRDNLTQQVVTVTATAVGLRVQLIDTSAQLTTTSSQLAEASTSIGRLLHDLEASNAATAAAREETQRYRGELSLVRADIAKVHAAVEITNSAVETGNSLSLGGLADNAESRRIAEIPEVDRTDAERKHIDTVGIQTESPSQPAEQK